MIWLGNGITVDVVKDEVALKQDGSLAYHAWGPHENTKFGHRCMQGDEGTDQGDALQAKKRQSCPVSYKKRGERWGAGFLSQSTDSLIVSSQPPRLYNNIFLPFKPPRS